ncbi:MAG TPA: hypothetical protein VGK49_05170, partial [Ilumatobacteraceae bacterium]
IFIENHNLANNALVLYEVRAGTTVGGLLDGTVYRVNRVDGDVIQLRATFTGSVTYAQNGAGDTITGPGGGFSWASLGFAPGLTITINGGLNDGQTYTIDSFPSANVMRLTATNSVSPGASNTTINSSPIHLVDRKSFNPPGTTPFIVFESDDYKNAVYTLIRVGDRPINGLEDGKTYYAISTGGGGSFQLAATAASNTPIAFSLSYSDTGALSAGTTHQFLRQSVDLTSGSGDQILRIDISGGPGVDGTQRITGPGGVALDVISPPVGDGSSSATSNGSAGGVFVGVGSNQGKITNSATIKAYVAGDLVSAGGAISITSTVTTNSSASSSNAAGGAVGVSGADAEVFGSVTNDAYVDTGTQVVAGGAFTLNAKTTINGKASARGFAGGLLGIGLSDSVVQVDFDTTAAVKSSGLVLAGGVANVTAESWIDIASTSWASGVGLGADGDSEAKAIVDTSNTIAEVGSSAKLEALRTFVKALVPKLHVYADSESYGTGFYGQAIDDATSRANVPAKVLIGGSAAVTGYEGVDLQTRYADVNMYGDSFARSTGLFGYVDADTFTQADMPATIDAAQFALISAGPRDQSEVLHGLDHVALYVTTLNGSMTIHDDAHVSRRSLAAGGSSEDGGGLKFTQSVPFKADVVIFAGKSPELVVNENGLVTKAVNVTVDGGQSVGHVTSGTVHVDPITNDDPGDVVFDAENITGICGAADTTHPPCGTWEFRDSFLFVRITNMSDRILQVNGINVINSTENPQVWLNPSDPGQTLRFLLKRTVAPTLVQIKNAVDPDVHLNGVINNPIGTTVIINADGGVYSLQDRPNQVVRTAILDIEATTDVGTPTNRVNVDVVDSESWQVPTTFLTSQASALTDSIFLGLHHFYAGEQVRYQTSGTPIGGLVNGRYYFVAAVTALSVQLAETGSSTVIALDPSASPLTDSHTLTPTQRFNVRTPFGSSFTDVEGHLRQTTAPTSGDADFGSVYDVVLDAITASGDIDVRLRPGVKETSVGSVGPVHVEGANEDGDFVTKYYPNFGPTPTLNMGAFGTFVSFVETTYDFRALDSNGNRVLPGATAGINVGATPSHNIVIKSIDPNNTDPAKRINVLAITEIVGTGFTAGPGDVHHIDVITDGLIKVREKTDDLRVGQIWSTDDDVILWSPAAIVDALNDAGNTNNYNGTDVIGENITMTAGDNGIGQLSGRGGVGQPGNFLEIDVDRANGSGTAAVGVLNVTDTASSRIGWNIDFIPFDPSELETFGVFITDTSKDLTLARILTNGDATLVAANGSIRDSRNSSLGLNASTDVPNIEANNVELAAYCAIGNPATLCGDIGARAPPGQEDSIRNDVKIDSGHGDTQNPGDVIVGRVGLEAAGSIHVTETSGALNVLIAQALNGDVRLSVREHAGQGDDLNLIHPHDTVSATQNEHAILLVENAKRDIVVSNPTLNSPSINALNGWILLRVGDNVTLGGLDKSLPA